MFCPTPPRHISALAGTPVRQRRNPRIVASTSGDALVAAISEITSRLFGASTAADVNAAFGEANRRSRADPKDKPIAVMWEK
jgi:hypothetical protein